ncbi:hypothetical protein [Crenobacter intestini]|uniref:Addiction module toxin RelE n=1 Tax=Crenobacter intestini TaxID=2563443 RepID=A0A4T0UW71_9NEIS|nr:hypothetical protein [Crenobacter intestini]TIC83198.1 hypothetical protein E5K04_08900 [Crenobacter intestini]
MPCTVTIDPNKYIQRFFGKHSQLEADIRHNIQHTLPEIIEHRPHKIKPAYHLKRGNRTILEYKIVVGSHNFRAAYTQDGEQVELFYITSTTIKREFVKELAGTTLVD